MSAHKRFRVAVGSSFLSCSRHVQVIDVNEVMIQFMQYCSFRQSSFVEVSPILEIGSDPSVANLSTVELYFHPPYTIILRQEVNSFLTALKLVN